VERLTYGALDFGVELGLKSGTTAANRMLDQVRFRLLTQSVRAGLPRPLETVFADIAALDKLAEFAKDALNMGFEGMLCIHPKQVAVVNESFSPTQDELAWAASVLEASLGAAGAFRFEGKMIDAPVLAHARRLIGES
jgi:(S)-citramalyl-CoA lyase